MDYRHLQSGPVHFILYGLALLMLLFAVLANEFTETLLVTLATLMVFCALSFHHVWVFDAGNVLAIRYGPLPLFRRKLLYQDMVSVEKSEAGWFDGAGIYYVPRHGWVYNLWGLECVTIRMKDSVVRIGTDDRDEFIKFIESKLQD